MSIFEKINADIKTAYKEKNTDAKSLLSFLKGEVTKVSKIPDDAEVVKGIKSMVKGHEKSLAEYGAPTLSEVELTILDGYLPSQLSEVELTTLVNEIISTEGLTGPQDMGKIMGYLKNNHGGEYDGKMASDIAKATLKSL